MKSRPGTGDRTSGAPVHGPPPNVALPEWNWTIGTVLAPFGRFGELRVRYETDFPERFARLTRICLRRSDVEVRLFDVARSREHKGFALLSLTGIESIDEANVWRGASVQVPRSEAMPLAPDEYYAADLVGMDVVTSSGRDLGKLEKVLPYPAHHVFQIGDILIPAVKEMVVGVDMAARRIVVAPPKGLLPGEETETADAD